MTTSKTPPISEPDIAPVPDVVHPTLPPTVHTRRRRRRPTGAPPPLPRKLGTSGKIWLALIVALIAWTPFALAWSPVLRVADVADTAFLRQVAHLRTPWLTRIVAEVDRLASGWAIAAIGGALIVLQMAFRRWRHFFTFIAAIAIVEVIGSTMYDNFQRPRPYGVTIVGHWAGTSFPSPPVGMLAAVLVAIPYSLVIPGRSRNAAKWATAALIAAYAGCRLYLGVDHPSDVVVGVALGAGVAVLAFRWFTPNEAFPVAYKKGKTAHLDVSGARGEAIRDAVQDQLGLTVVDAKPVGLAGSGGSTPLRLTVAGDPDTYLFAKLYAMNHVRADRWYKLGRTILYGRLEDEAPFQTVRRLVQYEDYTLRLLRDVGIPTAAAFGIVEITPEREYMLVTEFFDGAKEIGDADIDDAIIDDGLLLIRKLWDAGIAHRDIKPANLLVRDGRVLIIDVMFVQVRPSPWRQAVDLANMMLVLGVRTDAERVYRHALQYFTPDDIAEAFAATRGVASPSQLRAAMKQDGRDLIAEFRALAPPRQRIAIQRWSFRRVALALALVVGLVFVGGQLKNMFEPVHSIPVTGAPHCDTGDLTVLAAQSVPSATSVPCIASLPAGWTVSRVDIARNRSRYWLDSDQAGHDALEVTLVRRERCDVSGATRVPSNEVGMQRYERPERLPPNLVSTRYYLFPGGCAIFRFEFDEGAPASLTLAADEAISFQPRSTLVAEVKDRSHVGLCGAGAPSCPGGTAPGERE